MNNFHAICLLWLLGFYGLVSGHFMDQSQQKVIVQGIRENQPKQCLSYSLRNKDGLFAESKTMQRIHYT